MAAERTFWHKGLRVDVWAKSFKWTGLPFTVFLGSPPEDDKIRKMIDTAQKPALRGNDFRPEPRGLIARLLGRFRLFEKGGFVPVADEVRPIPPIADERVQRFFNTSPNRPGERVIHFTGPPVTREMQQLFGGYSGNGPVTGIIQLNTGVRVTYGNGVSILFAPIIETV